MEFLKSYIRDKNIIDYIIKPLLEPKELSDYNIGLYGLGYLLNTVENYNLCMCGACKGGYLDIVQLMIKNGANFWGYGLYEACSGGNLEVVQLMIKQQISACDSGLHGACEGGHLDIIKLMIEKGANDWNGGLSSACRGGHLAIIQLMIEKGANRCMNCYRFISEHLA